MARLEHQAGPIVLSVQERNPDLESYGLECVEDVVQRHRGPLTGLCSAMEWLDSHGGGDWLLMCPCDAPFLPHDLAMRLQGAAEESGRPVSVARYQDVLQPTFSLWNMEVFPAVREAVLEQGRGGLWQVLNTLPHTDVEWAVRNVPPFFNVNTPDELDQAARLLGAGRTGP